jgi:hypothetical protein
MKSLKLFDSHFLAELLSLFRSRARLYLLGQVLTFYMEVSFTLAF